ncbi:FAD-binding oxidoreductase [Rhizobium sp. FKY42]|uniref:FAD-binding oxidoreductase n=1 Tax=Rhizobium sp. FKY42 TaxID=2562310 RepID=UPI0010C02FCD|nr:FAD-binding oxidoreductase [Rhizobium sp. FKY42]
MKHENRIETISTHTDEALERIRAAIGAEHVLTGASLAEFRDPYLPEDWTEFDAAAMVQPASAEEVQAIVRIANEMRVPIWTCSRGMNKGYGGAAPRTEGCVVVNLRRMNRVIEINDELGYAVVEPGVSFMDLYLALKAGGYKWMGPTPDLAGGSVTGNSLENGVIYGPLAADQQVFCGMEAVLPNGELVRSGPGALPGAETFHTYKRGFGPSIDHLFLQSNFGIVTRMGVHLLPRPKNFHWFNAAFPQETDIGPIVEVMRKLQLQRVIEGAPRIYNTAAVALMVGNRPQFTQGAPGPVPEPVLQHLAGEFKCGRWMVHVGFWEDDAIVARKIEICREAFAEIGGMLHAQSWPYDDIDNIPMPQDKVVALVPDPSGLDVVHWPGQGIGAHTINGLLVPATARHMRQAHDMARTIFDTEAGFDYFSVQMMINPRTVIQGSLIVFDKTNPEETERAYRASRKLIEEGAKLGFMDYRAHVMNMDTVSGMLSFGDHALPRLLNRIKDALDPNGILAPGKQGIWPAAYR